MSDLVEFYRNLVPAGMGVRNPDDYGVMVSVSKAMETADEIERLREALHYYADKSHWHVKYGDTYILVDEGRIARAALGEGNND
jgi:hypothetical protein